MIALLCVVVFLLGCFAGYSFCEEQMIRERRAAAKPAPANCYSRFDVAGDEDYEEMD